MDFMLGASAAALANIGLLGAIMATYVQNMRLIRSYFTSGLVLVASLFIVQNIMIVIFWSNLYMAGPAIKNIVDAAAPYLFAINIAQSGGLAVLLWITRKLPMLLPAAASLGRSGSSQLSGPTCAS
ncbi:MAG TPA: hypothetical protein VMJ94_07530, partial [Nitrososphaera sp.]|nr:hypothetical protein [Nitrososphaera sp.]